MSAASDYDREKLQERLAKIAGGVAVINVGAQTEPEMKEKKDRVDDALHATRAAVEEGILPGGGVALLRAAKSIEKAADELEGDEALGASIVRRAIEAPLRQLCQNAGVAGSLVVAEVLKSNGGNGYNVATGAYEDLIAISRCCFVLNSLLARPLVNRSAFWYVVFTYLITTFNSVNFSLNQ